MRPQAWFAAVALLGAFLSPAPALGGQGRACADAARPVSLRCARVVTPIVDGHGGLWLVWAHDGHVYVQHAETPEAPLSPPRVVNRSPEEVAAFGEHRPKLAVDAAGRVHVTWTRRGARRFSGDVRYSRSLDGGRSFSEPVTLNSDRQEIGHRFDVLTVDAAGRLVVAWLDKRDRARAEAAGRRYRGAALYYRWSADGGARFQPDRKLVDHTCECCRLALAAEPEGGLVLLWRHIFEGGVRDHALMRLAEPGRPGVMRRASFDGWRIDACPHHGPALAVEAHGVWHLAWYTGAGPQPGLRYARTRDGGRSFSPPVRFGDPQADAGHPALLAVGRRIHLAWREFDGRRSRILGMRSEDGGETWSTARVLAEVPGEADYPYLVAWRDRVFLSWQTRQAGYRRVELTVRPEGG